MTRLGRFFNKLCASAWVASLLILSRGVTAWALIAAEPPRPSPSPKPAPRVQLASFPRYRIFYSAKGQPPFRLVAEQRIAFLTLGGSLVGYQSTGTPVPVNSGGTGTASITAHGVLLGEGTTAIAATPAGATDTVLQGKGSSADPGWVSVPNCSTALTYSTSSHLFGCGITGTGTVTSLSAGSLSPLFTTHVTNSTTTPVLSFILSTANANFVFAGPAAGAAAAATFRSLAPADIGLSQEGDVPYEHSGAFTRLGVGTIGQCLTSNGTDPAWGSCGSPGTAGGTNTAVQFNNSGAFGGDATNFFYNSATYSLTLAGGVTASQFTSTGSGASSMTLGSGASTSPSMVQASSGSGSNNTMPAYLALGASPSSTYFSYLFPCDNGGATGGRFCTSGAVPSADSSDFLLSINSADTVKNKVFDSSNSFSGALTVQLNAGVAVAAGQCVKVDSSAASQVIPCATADTTAGIGFATAAISSGATGNIAVLGLVTNPVLGSGTCAIGNWVVIDTTTNGDVKCATSQPANGAQLGFALSAQSTVGGAVTVLIDKR